MRHYDPTSTLISIHVPKTGGVSIRSLYQKWFGAGYLTHYKGKEGALPEKHDLTRVQAGQREVVVHGHFNKLRGFGIEAYYPEVKQFVTILRDPFERAVSRYFYLNNSSSQSIDHLRHELLNQKPQWSTFCHFPMEVTMDNYQTVIDTYFVEVGVLEHIEQSLARIARKLNKTYEPNSLEALNVSSKSVGIPYDLKQAFIDNNPLEYAVYNYVLSRYT